MDVLTRGVILCTRRVLASSPSSSSHSFTPYHHLIKRHYAVIPKVHLAYKHKNSPPPIDPPTSLKTHFTHLSELSSNLKYPLKHTTTQFQPEDYSPPLGNTEHLPFFFHRTPSNKLPIYSDFKVQGYKKVFTVVRKFEGDIKELSSEISRLIPSAEIEERAAALVIKGDHTTLLRHWLVQLGF